ncbi:MAG: hypothetical protein EOO07_01550 [Chitinophagaceae bacterium]|nr:MAG: hypothetical protein EOO07_01550 [Chitinophagaceae bacterium]
MELNTLSLSLCRVPAFSFNDTLEMSWPLLKTKIKLASPSFYEQIATVEVHQILSLPEKVQFTIWKYFNRAKYRATPFANFASFTLVPVGDEKNSLKIESEMQSHVFTNWNAKERVHTDVRDMYRKAALLYTNTSAYTTDTEIRYLRLNEGTFELASVEAFAELKNLLQFCNCKQSKAAIYAFMKTANDVDEKECKNLIFQLLQLQLMHTDRTPNITGEDYFKRIKSPSHTNEQYILAERKLVNGGLNSSKTTSIAEALQFLAQHLPSSQNNDLQNFKTAFLKKFEHQDVSLAVVMDPELGIGYGNLAQYEQADELIEQLENAAHQKQATQSLSYTALHQFLINGLLENQRIALENFESTQESTYPLPNTLSVIGHFYKNQAVIANAGGCTANSLLGRFTLGSELLAAHCKEIAELEQNANPNVLFFDIPYQAETHIDNVNRRKSSYLYEFPILTWSCQTSPLDFNDVMVRVQNDEIILFSKKLGKRLIPRLASAYNYSRSDLAVYRFLCDLQHQSIQSNLSFDFQTYVPGLNHYPRVGYKNVILSPAKWLIPKSVYQQKNQSDHITELQAWLKQKNINFLVKTGNADQTLCLNPTEPVDLTTLLMYCKQQGDRKIYLSEALIDEENAVADQNGKKYQAEFIISYAHKKQIYPAITVTTPLSIAHQAPVPTYYLPGSEWLYFEIFINPSKSNALLRNEIYELLKTHKNGIMKWFFIRYDENGKHLRLRLQVKDLTKRLEIIDHFNALLTVPILSGIVKDMAIKTYYPELARYGWSRMASVEQFFYLDSKYVLGLLAKTGGKNELYPHTLSFINQIMGICYPIFSDRLRFITQMAEASGNEFNINREGFKKINQVYTTLRKNDEPTSGLKQLENQARAIFMQCEPHEKPQLLADLIHMHINRLFHAQQRLHEAICYQFLYKQLLTERARLTFQAARQASA